MILLLAKSDCNTCARSKELLLELEEKKCRAHFLTLCMFPSFTLLFCFIRYQIDPNGTLSIPSVDIPDSGVYQCFGVSEVGEAATYTWVVVNSKFSNYFLI